MTLAMMDCGARGGIANYVNCGILRLSPRSNFGIQAGTRQRVPTPLTTNNVYQRPITPSLLRYTLSFLKHRLFSWLQKSPLKQLPQPLSDSQKLQPLGVISVLNEPTKKKRGAA